VPPYRRLYHQARQLARHLPFLPRLVKANPYPLVRQLQEVYPPQRQFRSLYLQVPLPQEVEVLVRQNLVHKVLVPQFQEA